jgi:hypothetical protein
VKKFYANQFDFSELTQTQKELITEYGFEHVLVHQPSYRDSAHRRKNSGRYFAWRNVKHGFRQRVQSWD